MSQSRGERLLDLGIQLLKVSKTVVAERTIEMWKGWNPGKFEITDNQAAKAVRDELPQFSQRACELAVAWVFYQHYLR